MSKRSGSPLPHERASKHYLALDVGVLCKVTYIWFEGSPPRYPEWKTRILNKEPTRIGDIPVWHNPEKSLVPVRIFRDPFALDPNKLVLCEVHNTDSFLDISKRKECADSMEDASEHEIQFTVKEEYGLCKRSTTESAVKPPSPEELNNAEDINIYHFRACLYAGVKISGSFEEWLPAQRGFIVGPCEGIEMGDHLLMACYILDCVCRDFGIVPKWEAIKPVWDVTFSTKNMKERGLTYIGELAKKVSTNTTIEVSAPDCIKTGCGYLECRQLESNGDPYTVMKEIVKACLE